MCLSFEIPQNVISQLTDEQLMDNFFNPVIPGLDATSPGITSLENSAEISGLQSLVRIAHTIVHHDNGSIK